MKQFKFFQKENKREEIIAVFANTFVHFNHWRNEMRLHYGQNPHDIINTITIDGRIYKYVSSQQHILGIRFSGHIFVENFEPTPEFDELIRMVQMRIIS